ncbi:hypothetical protein FKE98_00830 [Corynebacterium aurimucosum]|uniref:hypothetical protein n=1 Tax=Corynebacterium TaxID=1716 RepID=UPI0008A52DA8|nr:MULTISPECIES: hypothetical protein [Corynebacterium]MDK6806941.1 hypothetical protein [Corynebacterium aurimucosum]MTE09040.1 hypothetical protein [Corynebacterium guaraldiae]NJJ83259.1 hypothetical protein [Corynebacterium aurimucosum]OFK93418.1 hypothetical protein HMPREF2792_09425 [Corynebacterium sp. HMSC068H04]OFM33833.1 hypothetical protein HMPREF2698_05805 [Corynebacterium sp. HMSC072A02]
MRIRNAALAGATALAVTFGGSTVAFAQDAAPQDENASSTSQENGSSASEEGTKGEASLSSKIGDWFYVDENDNKGTEADGRAIFGSSKHEHCDADETDQDCTSLGDQPTWAKTFYGLGIASAVASVAGLIGVVYNFFVHGPSF